MPAFDGVLSEDEIRTLVGLIRSRADKRQASGSMKDVTIEAETLDPQCRPTGLTATLI